MGEGGGGEARGLAVRVSSTEVDSCGDVAADNDDAGFVSLKKQPVCLSVEERAGAKLEPCMTRTKLALARRGEDCSLCGSKLLLVAAMYPNGVSTSGFRETPLTVFWLFSAARAQVVQTQTQIHPPMTVISTSEIQFFFSWNPGTKNTLEVRGQKIGYIHTDERDLYIRIVPKLHWSPSSRGKGASGGGWQEWTEVS